MWVTYVIIRALFCAVGFVSAALLRECFLLEEVSREKWGKDSTCSAGFVLGRVDMGSGSEVGRTNQVLQGKTYCFRQLLQKNYEQANWTCNVLL